MVFFVSFGGGIGVNLFFIMSGFGLYYSVTKGIDSCKINWLIWIKRRLMRLLPSYLIVSITYYLMKGDLSIYNVLQLNFWSEGVRDFWFIPAIIVCYAIFPLVFISAKKWGFGKTIITLLFILICGNIYIELFSPYCNKVEIFTWRIPCFVVGIYLGYLSKIQVRYNRFFIHGALFLALSLCFVFTGMSRLFFIILTFCILPLITYLLVLLSKHVHYIQKILCYFGSRSLQIYLLHVSVLPLALTMLWKFNIVLYFFLTFIIAELLYQFTSYMMAKSKINM